jgi:hypothetical protein
MRRRWVAEVQMEWGRAGACVQAADGCGMHRPGRFADGMDVESFALKLPTITTRFNHL